MVSLRNVKSGEQARVSSGRLFHVTSCDSTVCAIHTRASRGKNISSVAIISDIPMALHSKNPDFSCALKEGRSGKKTYDQPTNQRPVNQRHRVSQYPTFATVGEATVPAVVGARQQIGLTVVVTLDDDSVSMTTHHGVGDLCHVSAAKHYSHDTIRYCAFNVQ